ncbi:hypothetical protein TRFO_03078 [Tritrichomonas foetus]|uniref:Aminotransferase class V domain-containing protein n=1 Tax=Tritrichomonas foetus TaxID=1144522 RepID=A0A1J4KU31_9EUKA|nr:hypothetical protein TRFO_03078 [Tritrichomonas foetus]|eukprot:OHT14785.1 hypothetical protein TRFO_03078 [Tritrichomonas foetus]
MSNPNANIDAVIVDFSKIFGFPNTAAIIVNKTFLFELKPSFPNNIIYAQVVGDNIIYSDEKRHDNTLQLNDLISIESGLELFQILGYEKMKSHTINLRNILYDQLSALTYSNDVSKCILYGNSRNTNILTFNILTNEKEYISDKYVVRKAYNKSILIEYGCHSFPFSCSHHIGINENDIYKFYSQKNNDNAVSDMVNRKPIGAIRVSIGWYNTIDDINHLIELIKEI